MRDLPRDSPPWNSRAWKPLRDPPPRVRRRVGAGVDRRAGLGGRFVVAYAVATGNNKRVGRRNVSRRARRRRAGRRRVARRRGRRGRQRPAVRDPGRHSRWRLSVPELPFRGLSAHTRIVARVPPCRLAAGRPQHHHSLAGCGLAHGGSAQAARMAWGNRRTGLRRICHRTTGAAERGVCTVPFRRRGTCLAVLARRFCRIAYGVVRLLAVGAAVDQRAGAGPRHLRHRLAGAGPGRRRAAQRAGLGRAAALAMAAHAARRRHRGSIIVDGTRRALAARFQCPACAHRAPLRRQELGRSPAFAAGPGPGLHGRAGWRLAGFAAAGPTPAGRGGFELRLPAPDLPAVAARRRAAAIGRRRGAPAGQPSAALCQHALALRRATRRHRRRVTRLSGGSRLRERIGACVSAAERLAVSLALVVAWLLLLAAGCTVWLALVPRREPGWLAAAVGHGVVAGMLLAAAATSLFARADTAHAWLRAAPALAVLVMLAAL